MRFYHLTSTALALLIAGTVAATAQARIGVAVPEDGDVAVLARQVVEGAAAAAAEAGAQVVMADDGCDAAGGQEAARRFVNEGVAFVVGFLCTEAIEAALPILTEAAIPVITPGVRTDSLTDRRDRTGWLVFRLAPRADGERAAAARIISEKWRGTLFAIVDDGTIYGRELAESVRIAVEESGLVPAYVDTFRPQLDNQIGLVGRLRNAGATHVVVGGDREDIAVMARDANELGYALTIAGGEALRAAPGEVELADGVLMVAPTRWEELAAASDLEALRVNGTVPEGYFLPSYAAVEVGMAALRDVSDPTSLAARIQSATVPTVIGEVAFDARGDVDRSLFRLYRLQDGAFEEVE